MAEPYSPNNAFLNVPYERRSRFLDPPDAYIHAESSRGLLIALTGALVRATKQPTLAELTRIHRFLRDRSRRIRGAYGTLFGARAFRNPAVTAHEFVARELG